MVHLKRAGAAPGALPLLMRVRVSLLAFATISFWWAKTFDPISGYKTAVSPASPLRPNKLRNRSCENVV